MNKSFAFFGREKEIEQLRTLHALRKHVLIVGPAGIGKTALLRQIRQHCPLLVCEETSSLRRICDSIERQLGRTHYKINVIERKNRLLAHLERRGEPVAFDHVAHTPRRVARFMAFLAEKIPVWIACRSDRAHEIGHIWEHLYQFTRMEIAPFTDEDTGEFVLEAIAEGNIQPDAAEHLDELHRMSEGNPRVLEQLLMELASHEYKMDGVCGLELLGLDRRIHGIHLAIKAAAEAPTRK
jgi:hypothetical protein